jgi:hypothetical protein
MKLFLEEREAYAQLNLGSCLRGDINRIESNGTRIFYDSPILTSTRNPIMGNLYDFKIRGYSRKDLTAYSQVAPDDTGHTNWTQKK